MIARLGIFSDWPFNNLRNKSRRDNVGKAGQMGRVVMEVLIEVVLTGGSDESEEWESGEDELG
jgi:hypothetical protein